jgi:hypothetical protein
MDAEPFQMGLHVLLAFGFFSYKCFLLYTFLNLIICD